MIALSYKSKQFLSQLLKIAVVVGCLIAFYWQWQARPLSLDTMMSSLTNLVLEVIPVLFILSALSWLVESRKWQYLINSSGSNRKIAYDKLRFRESVIQNLTAQASSYITPLRAGEFICKMSYFPKEERKRVAGLVFAGNLSQMMVTVGIGVMGLLLLGPKLLDLQNIWIYSFMAVLIGLVVWWVVNNKMSLSITWLEFFKVTGFSLLRYLLFASNWLLILVALGHPERLDIIVAKIGVMYLLYSILPIMQFLDLPVRWGVAALVFGAILPLGNSIILATVVIWISNSVFPTLVGMIFLLPKSLKAQAA